MATLMTLKIAVFAPMPMASVSTATTANPGFFASMRQPYRMSCSKVSICLPRHGYCGACFRIRGVLRDPAVKQLDRPVAISGVGFGVRDLNNGGSQAIQLLEQ